MTPIKEIWVIGNRVVFLDYADQTNFIADCVDEQVALHVALLFSIYKGKQAFAFKPSMRRMVPVGEDS